MAMKKRSSRGRPVAVAPALLLGALSCGVIFWKLGETGLVNGDEGFYHAVARNMLASGDFTRLEFTGEHRVYDTFMNAPLQYWARAALIASLGDNYWSMRCLSALFAVLAIVTTYWLAAGIGGTRAGLLAGLLLLTTFQFLFLHGARTGELEPIVCFVLLLTCLLFVRCVERDRGWLGHHLCLLALVNLKAPLVLIPLCAELVFLLSVRPARRRLAGWIAWGAAVAPFALAWHIGQLFALGDEAWSVLSKMSGQASGEALRRERGPLVNAAFYAQTMLFGAYPHVFVFLVAVVGMPAARMSRRRKRCVAHVLLVAITVLAFFLMVAKSYPWYVIPAYPFLCVLA
ncbi:MAG: phospholipid carrier-dependent glycosyltransferase, partial [Planctomycetota bacterium]